MYKMRKCEKYLANGYQSTRHWCVFFHRVISSQTSMLQSYMGRGPKFSGLADIKGHYQHTKFGFPDP